MSSLRQFFRFKEAAAHHNPIAELSFRAAKNFADLAIVSSSIPSQPAALGARDQAMLSCSMRLGWVSELVSLRMHQINFPAVPAARAQKSAPCLWQWARVKLDSYLNTNRVQITQGQIESVHLHQSVRRAVKPRL